MASVINQIKLGSVEYAIAASAYAECSTAAGTAAKVATICTDSDTTNTAFTLIKGVSVQVKFTNTNTAADPTLNVNATGAKSIYHGGSAISTKAIKAGAIYTFTYNGTQWELVSLPTAGYNTLGLIKTTSSVTTPTGYTACPIVDGVPLYMNTTYAHPTGEGNRHVPAGDQLKHGYHLVYDFNNKEAVWEAARQVPTGGSANNYLGWSSSGTAAWKTGFGKVANNGSSGIHLGLDLTSNTLSTYGGGGSLVSGFNNTISGAIKCGFVFGQSNSMTDSTAESTESSGSYSRFNTFIGYSNRFVSDSGGIGCVALGTYNKVCTIKTSFAFMTSTAPSTVNNFQMRYSSVAIGSHNTVGSSAAPGVAIGHGLNAGSYQTIIGFHNDNTTSGNAGPSSIGGTSGSVFQIGWGTASTKKNLLNVLGSGNLHVKGTVNGSGTSDYAEYFEWSDGNKNNEDRRGRFVTFDSEDLIRFANSEDDYILGVVSACPTVLGDACEEEWKDRYLKDIYGSLIEEERVVEEEVVNDAGEVIQPRVVDTFFVDNPNFDPDLKYEPRSKRPEWSPVGMMGKLVVDDDGTCEVNGYATPSVDGIATKGTRENGYRVMERLDESHIRILFK